MEASQDDLLQQLRELSVSEQEAKAKVEEREAQVQELQNMITELHQEMSLKDQDKLEQLQQLVQLEARVKELTQELQSSSEIIAQLRHETSERADSSGAWLRDAQSDPSPGRGIELLKTELSQRDSTIQKLRRDLLHSHQARDCQSAQLDFQEQRLWELQRELQEKQWELQRGHGRLQQLSTELQSTVRHSQELQSQLCEVRGQLVQVKGENEALLGCKRLQAAEVERLTAEVCNIQRANEEVQETQRRCGELEAELLVIKTQLSNCQNGTRDAQKKADEQIKQLQEEVARLDDQYSSVTHHLQERTSELQSLQKTHSELLVRDRECQRELSQTREELHTATLRAEEQHLKEVQIDELQQEVDRMLALLDKEREDGSQLEELQRLREDQQWLKDKLDERDRKVAALNLEAESLREQVCTRDRDAADLCTQLITSQSALQQVTAKLRSYQRELKDKETLSAELEQSVVDLKAELTQIQRQYTTCYSKLVVEEASVSKLRTDLQEVEGQRDKLESQLENQQSQLHLLTEKHWTAQQEVSSRDDTILKLTVELSTAQEQLISTQKELAETDLEMKSNVDEVVTLQKEGRRLQDLLRQKEEQLENIKHKFDLLQLEKETLLTQCDSQRVALRELSAEVQHWQQEAREQRESRQDEAQELRRELQEVQAHLQQQKFNQEHLHRELETAQKQQRDAEEEVLHKEAALRSQDSELNRLKAEHLEAQRAASETEATLQLLTDSTDLYKHKYQACLNKIAELESTLHCHEEDLKEARAQVLEREEQVLRLQAEAVVLRDDVKARCAQLESGDDALTTLGQRLRDTQGELELSHTHAQECELVIYTLRDNMAIMRRQIEEKEEAMVKVQTDFSVYRATHIHSDSYYESQLSHVHELEQTLSQTLERCGEGARELSACQLELEKLKEDVWKQRQLKDASLAEAQRLQELTKQLQADAVHEAQSRQAELDTLEHRATDLVEQLEAAQRQCEQKEQAVQKRNMLLRQSEADLVQARDKIRSKVLESERHVQTLQADLRQAKKEKRERENECAMLRSQLVQQRDELKEAQASCRDSAQELARHEEKVLLLEGGQQRAQEQLAERVAEVVRAEQTQRRLQAELRELQQRLETTEEDLHECRTLLEQTKKDASNSRQAQLSSQQEAAHLQQEKHWLQEELTSTKQSFTHLQEQLNERSTTIQALREELAQDQLRKKEQLNWAQGARNRESSLETERDQLRKELETARNQQSERERLVNTLQERVHELQSATVRQQEEVTYSQGQLQQSMRHLQDRDTHMKKLTQELAEHSKEMTSLKQQLLQQQEQKTELERKNTQQTAELQKLHSESRLSQDENRTFEGRLAELNAQLARSQLWGQHQLATLQSREEELVLLKVEMATLRESYHTKVAQVETLNTQMDSTEQKYRMAVGEVEMLRQALGDARTDSSRLQRESELVVTNVNQWVREQKQTNEKLGLKIKDQHKKIIHLTAEKDHLQESVEKLQAEIRRLKTELDEQRMETEGCKAVQAQRRSDQRSTSVLEQSHQHSALSGVFSHQREKLSRNKPLAVRLDRS